MGQKAGSWSNLNGMNPSIRNESNSQLKDYYLHNLHLGYRPDLGAEGRRAVLPGGCPFHWAQGRAGQRAAIESSSSACAVLWRRVRAWIDAPPPCRGRLGGGPGFKKVLFFVLFSLNCLIKKFPPL
jgi:hypothetical protein